MKPLDPASRRLIADVLSGDQPAPGAQARTWSKLAQQLHAPLPPTAAAAESALEAGASVAPGGGVLAQLAAVKLVVGAVGAGVLVAAASVWYASQEPAAAPPQPPAASAPHPAAVRPLPAAAPTLQPPAASSSLSDEAQLLAQAQRALTAGNPAKALGLVDEHRRRYAQGALAQERDAARIFALCALGRDRDAREARRQFLHDWPGSALTSRVRTACTR